MDYFSAIIFGIVQGITEFVPVSSSGHLVILHKLIDLPIQNELSFDVVLHLASLLAVIVFFKKDILSLIKDFFNFFIKKNNRGNKLPLFIILATIPAALAGFLFEDFIESTLHSLWVIVFTLLLGGVFFLIFENIGKQKYNFDNLNWKNTLIIGFAQALALIPGTSRSGATIVAGLGIGLKREIAVKFSFLMSIPIILGASFKKIPSIDFLDFSTLEIFILIIAFISSFISAFFVIKFFMKFVKINSLKIFAIYRFILAFIILFFIL